jgi:hypothetical protein
VPRFLSHPCWQLRTTLLIAALGPPAASLILFTAVYLPGVEWQSDPTCIAPLFLLALAVGYVFGILPAVLTSALYCGALTVAPRLRHVTLLRSALAATIGAVIGDVWFHAAIGSDSLPYTAATSFVACILSLASPTAPAVEVIRASDTSAGVRPQA